MIDWAKVPRKESEVNKSFHVLGLSIVWGGDHHAPIEVSRVEVQSNVGKLLLYKPKEDICARKEANDDIIECSSCDTCEIMLERVAQGQT